MNEPPAPVRLMDLSEFEHSWASWAPGDPFPLLRGPAADRYLEVCSKSGVGSPAVTYSDREGVVISVGADGRAAGRLLAAATGRTWHHVDIDELILAIDRHSAKPIALVGLSEEFVKFGDWPGIGAARLGVLATRDLATLVCLVYRTLTVSAFPRSEDFTVMHPIYPEAHVADAVEHAELGPLLTTGYRALKIWAYGAECSMNLPDAMICGRADLLTQPLPAVTEGRGTPSCLRGEGCFRQDLMPEQRLSPANIDTQIVFAESCASIALGNNIITHEMNVALAFMQTHSVAVIGALASHNSHPAFLREFESALDSGLTLGDVLFSVNSRALSEGGTMSQFGLLGDPTLALAVTSSSSGTESGIRSNLRLGSSPALEESTFKRIKQLYTVLERLRRLRWINFPVDDTTLLPLQKVIEDVLAGDASRIFGKTGRTLADQLTAMQTGFMETLVRHVHSTQWSFTEGQLFAFREVTSEPCICPACGRPRAVLLQFEHRVDAELRMATVQCRRCHDVWWSTGDAPPVTVAGDWECTVRKGSLATIHRKIVNHSSGEVFGAIGLAATSGAMWDLGQGDSIARSCRLAPNMSLQADWTVDASARDLVLRDYEIPLLTLFNGIYSSTSTRLILLGGAQVTTGG